MTAYDVQIVSPSGKSGETVRVEADDTEAAGAAALVAAPEGWVVERVSDATDHGEAWGLDLTQNVVPAGVVLISDGAPPPDVEPYVFPEPAPDYVEPEAVDPASVDPE